MDPYNNPYKMLPSKHQWKTEAYSHTKLRLSFKLRLALVQSLGFAVESVGLGATEYEALARSPF